MSDLSAPRKKDWADEESDEEADGDLAKDFAKRQSFESTPRPEKGLTVRGAASSPLSPPPQPATEDALVASLLSRISGLSTNATPFVPASSPSTTSTTSQPSTSQATQPSAAQSRPKPNTTNPLFGRALAGVKTDRSSPSPTTAPAPVALQEAKKEVKEEKNAGKELLPDKPDGGRKGQMTENIMDDTAGGWGSNEWPSNSNGNGNGDTNGNANGSGTNGHTDGLSVAKDEVDTRMSETGSGLSGLISNEFQVEVKLADLQADPSSPLYSITAFEDLPIHEDLMKGIYSVGFKKPSKIQEKALPMLLMNPPRNLIGQSQSGTGKTAAFTLNMLSRVDPALRTPQAICLAPSRELARQIQEVIDKIGRFTQIKTMLAVPGSWSRRVKIDKHILIGTPGTLIDMLSKGGSIFDPKQIRVFVLDEADEMIAMQGLGDQTNRIKRTLPPGVQNVLFSATFTPEVQEFAEQFAPEANKIFLKKEEVTVEAIKQLYLECDGEEAKYDALSALYDCMSIGQSIVFCRRKDTADRIADRLTSEGHSVASLHGDKMTRDRDDILDGFRNGKTKVLITTNVVARGIDIQQVNMVVNYDVPDLGPEGQYRPDIETYIHRIGRTGRFGRKGCSVIFVHDARSKSDVNEIMAELGKPMKKIDATRSTDLEQLEKALKIAMKGPN